MQQETLRLFLGIGVFLCHVMDDAALLGCEESSIDKEEDVDNVAASCASSHSRPVPGCSTGASSQADFTSSVRFGGSDGTASLLPLAFTFCAFALLL